MERVSRNLKRLRFELALPAREVAERGGLCLRLVQKAETGYVNLTMETVAKLAVGLGVDVNELFQPLPRK